jgi:hypothetical protein
MVSQPGAMVELLKLSWTGKGLGVAWAGAAATSSRRTEVKMARAEFIAPAIGRRPAK